ncbi:hypothetical protein SAMN05661012_00458 [Chitinophaga sancti]|uniref:Group II intron, maturase-specific domain n=1 Tax=Chitinophaga sancti TaxID=1004 RepID=A0A1K1M5B4_9BACT|nr:hypothetical protein SAMN05661012_00458 [Chitinophaga sancti]
MGAEAMLNLDKYVRTRLRICIWKEWRHPRRRVVNLLKLGVGKMNAIKWGTSSKGLCRIAHSRPLRIILNNAYLMKLGYTGFLLTHKRKVKTQTSLF